MVTSQRECTCKGYEIKRDYNYACYGYKLWYVFLLKVERAHNKEENLE